MSSRTPAARSRPAEHGPAMPAPRPVAPARAGGQALDGHTQAEMGARFGHDFSQVRIHTDSQAAQSAESVGAEAYALGSDIVFGSGQFTPGSPETNKLLAHELTHVVQQAQWGGPGAGAVSRPGDPSEREAERAADLAMAGEDVSVLAAPTACLSRSFLDGEDPENDFWGTKSNLGQRAGSTVDSAFNTFWDGAGLIPGVGTIAGGVSTGIDLAKAGVSGAASLFFGAEAGAERMFGMGGGTAASLASERYGNAAGRFMHDAEWDGLGMVPGLGSVMSAGSLGYDLPETISRGLGRTPNPAVGDHWDKAMKGAEGIVGGLFGGGQSEQQPQQ